MKTMMRMLSALCVLVFLAAGAAHAQYQPVPNYTGIGAGFNFRQAVNQRFSGSAPIAPRIVALPYGSLPSEQDGDLFWCADCKETAPCVAGGSGAWAFGSRGAWWCGNPPLEADLNANGYNITNALSVQTVSGPLEAKDFADANWRELLNPGSGIQVGNGTATPFTAIDEGANISGHVNGVINVKAPPYNAKGDGVTDDTAAINAAIAHACSLAVDSINQLQAPEVYLPATPGTFYHITSPLLDCGTKLVGAGMTQTGVVPAFDGPAIIVQNADPSWAPPLASSVALTDAAHPLANIWSASASYVQWKEILDSNGNVEVQTASACTSGSGSHPTWPTVQGNTVADNTCTWQLAMIGTQLATGTGSALDTVSPEFFPGAEYGPNNGYLELSYPRGVTDQMMNGLGAFTVEFYVNMIAGHAGQDAYLLGFEPTQPEAGNIPGLRIRGAYQSGTTWYWAADVDIAGAKVTVSSTTAITFGVTHHVALTYNGTTLTIWVDGASVGTAAASGNLTIPAYEPFVIQDGVIVAGVAAYPDLGKVTSNLPLCYYDSLRISDNARYTAAFTKPTAKFGTDANTRFLLNFPTTAPVGTVEGYNNVYNINVFIPIETSQGYAEVGSAHIGDMYLAGQGIYANWMINSEIENIQMVSSGPTCVYLHDNDFQDTVRNVMCGMTAGSFTGVGFILGNQSNNNLYDHLHCDGQYTCTEQFGGSGTYILPDYTARGDAVYPFAFIQGQALLESPTTDIESTNSGWLADVYSYDAYAPIEIHGGQLTNGNTSGASLALNGGAPFVVTSTDFVGGATPAELLNVLTAPTSPVTIHDSVIPTGLTLSNVGAEILFEQGGTWSGLTPTLNSGLMTTKVVASSIAVGALAISPAPRLIGTYTSGSGGSVSVPVPVGVVNGELLTACITLAGASNNASCPTGWTTVAQSSDSSANDAYACSRIASSEPASYTFTYTSGFFHGLIVDWGLTAGLPVSAAGAATGASSTSFTLTSSGTAPAPEAIMDCVGQDVSATVAIPANQVAISDPPAPAAFANSYYVAPAASQTFTSGSSATWAGVQISIPGSMNAAQLSGLNVPLTLVGSIGVGATPQALANFGTCNSSTEGLSGTETNSTAACAVGATATSGGTTHCRMYCNGTNWVQTGL